MASQDARTFSHPASSGQPRCWQSFAWAGYAPWWLTTRRSGEGPPQVRRNLGVVRGPRSAARQRHSPGAVMGRMLPFSSMLAIEARDVEKTFRAGWIRRRQTEALRGVSLAVPRRAIVGVLGPNGAG